MTAEDPRFSYFGNVSISQSTSSPSPSNPSSSSTTADLPLQDLFPHYTHLLLAIGSSSPTPLPPPITAIPALDVVRWYTGAHPAPPPPPLETTKHLTLIGHGNVSLDVARLLLTPPEDLSKHDIPSHVLDHLRKSKVEHVDIASRRGPAEAAFTAKELRELLTLPNCTLTPIPSPLLDGPSNQTRQQKRILDLLRRGSVPASSLSDGKKTSWRLLFFRSPVSTASGSITYEVTELDQAKKARGTGVLETIDTDLVISSVGSRTSPFDPSPSPSKTPSTGASDPSSWFDAASGRIRNAEGRVLDGTHENAIVKNVYTSGWASHGAKGVLATTMYDAYEVGDRIMADLSSPPLSSVHSVKTPMNPNPTSLESVPEKIADVLDRKTDGRVITWDTWKKVEAEEKKRGEAKGKVSERMSWSEVQAFLGP